MESVHLEVKFRGRGLATPLWEELSRDPEIEVNILRGRVSRGESWYELEVSGRSRKVMGLMRFFRECGASVRSLRMCPSFA